MSSVTNASQSSASVGVRLAKLQTLHQVLTQGKSDQEISNAFASLKKIDQEGIRKKILCKAIDPSFSRQKKALVSVVKEHIGTLSKSKAGRAFQTNIGKSRITTNPFTRILNPVQTKDTGSFCAPRDLANFRASFKAAAKIESASHIINTYHLDELIETYLHRSCSDLNESGKVKLLHELMFLAYGLSEIEELPSPGYSSLLAFFQEVEARNLIRMMRKIDETQKLPDLPEGAKDLQVSKKSTETIQKAECLRSWILQHQDFLTRINGSLHLIGCRLSLVPKEIGQLEAVQRLYLGHNNLVGIPKEIGQLKALKELHLGVNFLIKAPKEIGQLQALKVLDLSDNYLVTVPKEIGQLETLECLHLGKNFLVKAPKEFCQLRALKELLLNDNRLVRVPKGISQLKALQVLWLNHNRLVSVTKEIGQLKALQDLRLNHNRLVSLPKQIDQLQALQDLRLNDNCFVKIPKEIFQLKALRILDLSNNCLVKIHKEICQLETLEWLQLNNNCLVKIPKEIGQLKRLEMLHLDNNGLISLPIELERFNDNLKRQNEQFQLKNILRRLSLCVTGQHNTKKIADLLSTMERLCGKETRSQIHRCVYEAAQKTAKTDKTLHKKLKDKHFARKAFVDDNINPKLKAAAIATFRKSLEKQAPNKK